MAFSSLIGSIVYAYMHEFQPIAKHYQTEVIEMKRARCHRQLNDVV